MPHEGLSALWNRLRSDVVVRTGALYAAASWFLIGAADTFGVEPGPLRTLGIGLGIGFFVVLLGALAVRWLTHHFGRAGAPVIPARGQRRAYAVLAVVGILCVLSLGMYAVRAQAARAAVPEAAQQLAILPFHGTGSDEVRELAVGMVDLLSASLNDVAGIRTVATRTVLAQVGNDADAMTGEVALETARRVEAASVLTGSITAIGERVRLLAEIRDVTDGAVLATAQVEGALVNALSLTDELAVALLRELWRSRAPLPTVNVAALTTGSPVALRAYLRGEADLRAMRFDSAAVRLREAVAADSTFALAWLRLAEVAGWIHDEDGMKSHLDHATAFESRLPERDRMLLTAQRLLADSRYAAFDTLRVYALRYPDDPLAWYALGDARFHYDAAGLYDPRETIDAFMRSARLDPSFALGLTHAVELAIRAGDRAAFDSAWALWEPLGNEMYRELFRLMAAVRWAPNDSILAIHARALRSLDPASDRATIGYVHYMVEWRARADPEFDPLLAVGAADTFLALFGEQDWAKNTGHDIRTAAFAATGQVDSLIAGRERLFDALYVPEWGAPKDVVRAIDLVQMANREEMPLERAAAAAALLEGLPDSMPTWFTLFERYAQTDMPRARRLAPEWEAEARVIARLGPPGEPLDTAAVIAIADAWVQIALGDTTGGVVAYDAAIERLGFRLAPRFVQWRDYGLWLVAIPERRRQGIRVLLNSLWISRRGTIQTWQALAQAYEAEGDQPNARLAYGHLVRLLEYADPWRRPMYDEAAAALARLDPDR